MSTKSGLKKLYRSGLSGKQDQLDGQPALLGDGQGNVEVPGMTGYHYARIGGQPAIPVYNAVTSPDHDLAVLVGVDPRQPGLIQVLSRRGNMQRYGHEDDGESNVPDHGDTHSYGQGDPVTVYLEQIAPLRICPGDGLQVKINPRMVIAGGQVRRIGTLADSGLTTPATVSLSAYAPTTANKARWVLLTISTSGSIVATAGSLVDRASLAHTDIPATPADTAWIIGAVRMFYGQTAIAESKTSRDILDLRWPMAHLHRLDDLADVSATSPSDGDALTWDADLAAWVPAAGGGGDLSQSLLAWTEGEAYELLTATYDADGVLESGTVSWPDGSAGVWTRTTKNTTWLAVDAYTVTHVTGGKTVTQAAVTRDANGNITAKPALTIA